MGHAIVPKLKPRELPILSIPLSPLSSYPCVLSFLVLLPLPLAAPPKGQIRTTVILYLHTLFSRLLALHRFGPLMPPSVVISIGFGALRHLYT